MWSRRALRIALEGRSATGSTVAFAGVVLIVFEALRRFVRDHTAGVVSAWSVAAFLRLLVQNKLYSYHCLPLLAPAALELAWRVDVGRRRLEAWPLRRSAWTSAAWVALAIALVPAHLPRQERAWSVVRGTLSLRAAQIAWDDTSGLPWSVSDYLEVGDYLRDQAPEGATA